MENKTLQDLTPMERENLTLEDRANFVKAFLLEVSERDYKAKEGKMRQVERNALKVELVDLMEFILSPFFETFRLKEGLGIEIMQENLDSGNVPIVAGITMKATSFNVVEESELYLQQVEEKERVKREKLLQKQKDIQAKKDKAKANQIARALKKD